MKKYFYASLIALCLGCSNKKETNQTLITNVAPAHIRYPFLNKDVDWKKLEVQDDALKKSFVKSPPDDFKYEYYVYTDTSSTYRNLDSLKKDLHVMDFNADGKNDLIFDGASGGEPNEIAFYLNTDKGLKLVLKDFQKIQKIEFQDKRINRLYIYDPGCCAEYLFTNKVYEVFEKDNMPVFKQVYLTAHHEATYFPGQYYTQPVNVEVLNDKYKLRVKPMVDDTSMLGLGGDLHYGNDIGLLKKGTQAVAIAEHTDATGRKWFLVEIPSRYKVDGGLFYEPVTDTVVTKIGWISSRFVKKV